MSFGFWHCTANVQVLHNVVFGLIQTFFRQNFNMEWKSSTQDAEIDSFKFLPIDNVWLDASVRFSVWNFFVRRMRLR